MACGSVDYGGDTVKKIPSVFQRNYDGDRLVRDEVVPGCEWVLAGEGVATCKWDGTATMIDSGGIFYKRYDRKRHKKTGDFRAAPDGWIPCEDSPNEHTGHWPGWIPVGDGPEDKWLREAHAEAMQSARSDLSPGTYEAIGPHFQGNPHNLDRDMLIEHGFTPYGGGSICLPGRSFLSIKGRLADLDDTEGIVFHHPDGRMAKIKRKDFGLPWPVAK